MKIDAKRFDRMARSVLAPVYPAIARQILDRTGINSGTCLDIGCGGGYLGAALAHITDLFVFFFDQSQEMLEITRRTIVENNLQSRAVVIQGDVAHIDLPDSSVDLAVSRGSVFFWEDCVSAFREVFRVLAPGGMAYVGGGFGSAALREEIVRTLKERGQDCDQFRDRVQRNLSPETRTRFAAALNESRIPNYAIFHTDEEGLWIIIRK